MITSGQERSHDVIGMTGNICCEKLYHAAQELRLSLIEKRSDAFESFKEIWDETMQALEIFVRLNDRPPTECAETMAFSKIWEKFIGYCREFDFSSADYFEDHRAEFIKAFDEKTLAEIEAALGRFDLEWIAGNIEYKGD